VSYFNVYRNKLVGGHVRLSKLRMRPGHIISFNYNAQKTKKIPRLVFILNANDTRGTARLVHAINLEHLSWSNFLKVIRRILISDTITIIKRKYEIRGPFDEILDRPLSFYKRILKPYIETDNAYRTYKYANITDTKLWALDYSKFFSKTDDNRNLLINKDDSLVRVNEEKKALYEMFEISTGRLKDRKYRQLVIQRFGTEDIFRKSIAEINEMVDNNEDTL